ncbi:hypothetical protein D3C75_953200 [compost metagenome]
MVIADHHSPRVLVAGADLALHHCQAQHVQLAHRRHHAEGVERGAGRAGLVHVLTLPGEAGGQRAEIVERRQALEIVGGLA